MSETPTVTPIELEEGRPEVLTFNRPVKFRIELLSGGYVEGIIPANSEFTLCSQNRDFAKVDIIIDGDTFQPIEAVQ